MVASRVDAACRTCTPPIGDRCTGLHRTAHRRHRDHRAGRARVRGRRRPWFDRQGPRGGSRRGRRPVDRDAHRAEPEQADPRRRPRRTSRRPSRSRPTRSPIGSGSPVRTCPYDMTMPGRAAGRRDRSSSRRQCRDGASPGRKCRSGRAAAAPRRRLLRDAGAALLGLSAVALVVMVAQQVNSPHDGGVRGITHYRGSSDPPGSDGDTATSSIGSGQAVDGASQTPGALSATASPGAPGPGRLTLPGTTTPKPTARSNGTPTTTVGPATPTPRITARPTTTPGTDGDAGQHGHTRSDRSTDSSAHA